MPIRSQALFYACGVFVLTLFGGCKKEEGESWSRLPGSTSPASAPLASSASSSMNDMNTARATTPTSGTSQVSMEGNLLKAAGLGFVIPEGWADEEPTSNFRLAQFRLTGKEGPAELVITHFGASKGGAAEANIQRWVAQFSDETTATVPSDVARIERDGLRIALVKTSGTYTPTAMMGPAKPPQPNQAMFGMIIEGGPEGTLFVKTVGPKSTMKDQDSKLETFAQSVRRLK